MSTSMALRNRLGCPSANSGDTLPYVRSRKTVQSDLRLTRATLAHRSNEIHRLYRRANRTCVPRISQHRVRRTRLSKGQNQVLVSNPVSVAPFASSYTSACGAALPQWIRHDDGGYSANG